MTIKCNLKTPLRSEDGESEKYTSIVYSGSDEEPSQPQTN